MTEKRNEREGRTFERELPEGYAEALCIDATSKRTGIFLNLAALGIIVAIVLAAYFAIRPKGLLRGSSPIRSLVFLAALLAYIVLHELVHGAAYKALTGQKLKFGLTLSVAYCGVPDIYVYRRTALIALLAPFVVFNIVFGVPMLLLDSAWDRFAAAILFALHVGGCAGDLYDTLLYLFRFRDGSTLMRDTGPKQSFFVCTLGAAADEE